MTQAAPTIGANESGTQYRTDDNNGKTAIVTSHMGSSRPSYALQGLVWMNNSAAPIIGYYMYDGTTDILIGTFNSNTHTWVPAGTASQAGTETYITDTSGSPNIITGALSPVIAGYTVGMPVRIKVNNNVTGATTINLNGIGATPLKKNLNQTIVQGDILAGEIIFVVYDGTNFQLLSPANTTGFTVNNQTGTSYTLAYSDRNKLVTFSNASNISVTIPEAGTTGFDLQFSCALNNRGAAPVTLTPTSCTIDGQSSLVLNSNQGCDIYTDGSNYFTQRGTGAGSTPYATYHSGSAIPTWNSTSTIIFPTIIERDSTDTINIKKTSSTTINVGTSGVNGLDTGSLANSTWYHCYYIGQSSGTANMIFSATNEAVSGSITLPSGYTFKRQSKLSFLTDGSGNIRNFVVKDWNGRIAEVLWNLNTGFQEQSTTNFTNGITQVVNGQNTVSGTYTTQSLSAWVPPTSQLALLNCSIYNNSTGGSPPTQNIAALAIKANGLSGDNNVLAAGSINGFSSPVMAMPQITDSSQIIQWCTKVNQSTTAGTYAWISVAGFVVNQVL